jgi:hypothetical protein
MRQREAERRTATHRAADQQHTLEVQLIEGRLQIFEQRELGRWLWRPAVPADVVPQHSPIAQAWQY